MIMVVIIKVEIVVVVEIVVEAKTKVEARAEIEVGAEVIVMGMDVAQHALTKKEKVDLIRSLQLLCETYSFREAKARTTVITVTSQAIVMMKAKTRRDSLMKRLQNFIEMKKKEVRHIEINKYL